jgi:signal transduction histidine kinase
VQLVEVQQSRARLAAGQHAERRRIERNLHDQQRLLALGLQLQAASVNGTEQRLREAIVSGIAEVRQAVVELRDLANGLCPAVLNDGGLHGALKELTERTGIAVAIDADLHALAPDLEEAAWFIVCEAVANAQQHGEASAIRSP